MKKSFMPQEPSRTFWLRNLCLYWLSVFFSSTKRLRRLSLVQEHATFIRSNLIAFENNKIRSPRRESIWKKIIRSLNSNGPISVLEFGVAHGYTTNYFLSRTSPGQIAKWYGFDTFTGLPDSWRDLSVGTFTNGGSPPRIQDKRVTWYVGLVEQTFTSDLVPTGPRLVIFDLDLLGPTMHCYSTIRPFLEPGDYIYFDEAFDQGEFSVIHNNLMKDFKLELLAYTHSSCAFRVLCKL